MTWMRTPPESVFSTASKGPLASAQPAKSKNSGRSLLIFIWPSDLSHEIPRCESPAEWGSGALRRDVRINHHAHRNGRFGAPKLQWRSLPVRLAGATGKEMRHTGLGSKDIVSATEFRMKNWLTFPKNGAGHTGDGHPSRFYDRVSGTSDIPTTLMNAPRERRNIPALTGLRGVAALWVVFFHLTVGIPLLQHGYLGVDVFFLLICYLLAYFYASNLPDAADYVSFIRARVARIYPMHLTALCVLALMVVTLPGFAEHYPQPEQRWGFGPFVASLLLVQNWAYFLPTSWNTPSWSLSAEWFAYLLFPMFVFATQWQRSIIAPLLLAGSLLLVLFGAFALRGLHVLNGYAVPRI